MGRVRKSLAGLAVAVLADAPSEARQGCKPQRRYFVTRADLGAVPGACFRGYYFPDHRGAGQTEFVLLNKHYQEVATVHAVGGYLADPHEFVVTPQSTALIASYVPVAADLSEAGGEPNVPVCDYVVQEIDIATNELLWEWRALDHIPSTWQLRAGESKATLHDVGAPQPKDGFETRLSLPEPAHVVRVQALGVDGKVLGTSPAIYWSDPTGPHA